MKELGGRCEDIIRIYFNVILYGDMKWFYFAWVMFQWPVVVNVVMKFRAT
jgi:hypothetical protein